MELPECIQNSQRCQNNAFYIAGNSKSEWKDLLGKKKKGLEISLLSKSPKKVFEASYHVFPWKVLLYFILLFIEIDWTNQKAKPPQQ